MGVTMEKRPLDPEDRDILQLVTLAHRYSLRVLELPFLWVDRESFAFRGHKSGLAIEVILHSELWPQNEDGARDRA